MKESDGIKDKSIGNQNKYLKKTWMKVKSKKVIK